MLQNKAGLYRGWLKFWNRNWERWLYTMHRITGVGVGLYFVAHIWETSYSATAFIDVSRGGSPIVWSSLMNFHSHNICILPAVHHRAGVVMREAIQADASPISYRCWNSHTWSTSFCSSKLCRRRIQECSGVHFCCKCIHNVRSCLRTLSRPSNVSYLLRIQEDSMRITSGESL